MEKFMAGLGIFCGVFLAFFLIVLFSGDLAVMVPIVGFSTVIAMLGVVLINQQRELEARRRAERRRLNQLNSNNEQTKGSLS
ncbi:hypothetical protein GRF59_19500 [Paenibacillus sp. HJL G12]|uniref:Uncharacterized protein n=1 Tax=Paenibacillus dendrobii TaxID=2691084 RepID=A0A7X3IKW8_9BACL|nr:hypothetical protein [Paenibacillus dendrobii]MWV45804.1 hypothetical protein [Paenibacillus dendrobii]